MDESTGQPKVVNLFTRKPVEQAAPIPAPVPETVETEDGDAEFFAKNGQLIARVAVEAGQMEKMISRLPGFARNERNVGIRLEGLKGTPLSALCDSILTSTQNMWREKPSYYLAVIGALSKKIDALQRTKYGSRGNRIVADMMFALSNFERVVKAIEQIDIIGVYVMDEMGIEPNQTELTLHGSAVAGFSLGQLCDTLLDSPKEDWAARANYYGAAILELEERRLALKAVLDDHKKEEDTGA